MSINANSAEILFLARKTEPIAPINALMPTKRDLKKSTKKIAEHPSARGVAKNFQ
jgi:hypothetical protein